MGEKRFDRLVYGGLNGVGTFMLTLPLAYWAQYGKGAQMFEKAALSIEKTGISARTAKDIMTTTALGLGGTVMIAPIRLAEAYRKPLVETLSPGQKDKNTADLHMQEVPPQTWGSLAMGRITAWLTVFTSFKIVGAVSKQFGHPKALGQFEERFAKGVVSLHNKIGPAFGRAPLDVTNKETKLFRYGKLAALDIFATIAASILLYTGSRFFARKHEEKREHQEQMATVSPSPVSDVSANPQQPEPAHEAPIPTTVISGEKAHPGPVNASALAASL